MSTSLNLRMDILKKNGQLLDGNHRNLGIYLCFKYTHRHTRFKLYVIFLFMKIRRRISYSRKVDYTSSIVHFIVDASGRCNRFEIERHHHRIVIADTAAAASMCCRCVNCERNQTNNRHQRQQLRKKCTHQSLLGMLLNNKRTD